MSYPIHPDPEMKKRIENAVRAESHMCWTCGSCDFECPVNRVTGFLRPQKIVRMATLGLMDELQHLPEVWNCLTCRRCNTVCPNPVKPAMLIEYTRRQAIGSGFVSKERFEHYKALFKLFQRVRWHATAYVMHNQITSLSHDQWCEWLQEPVSEESYTLTQAQYAQPDLNAFFHLCKDFYPQACFTCGECSSSCHVSGERSVFDPRTIFRMFNLGLLDRLKTSPSIWLCVQCQRCSDACSQKVKGHQIIEELQRLAFASGAVDDSFPIRMADANRLIFNRLLDQIDVVFNFSERQSNRQAPHYQPFLDSVCIPCDAVANMTA